MSKTIDKLNENVMHSYGRFPVVLKQGFHEVAVDEDGKEYIDFGSGIGTNSLGYCNEDWVNAVCNQVKTMQHTSNYYYTEVQANFASKLCSLTGYKKVFFGNSGAEANECAIKIARKYSFDKYGKGRHNIITLTNSFHGRTMATLSATGQDDFHNYFFPFVEGFINVKTNDVDDLINKIDDSVCAVMFEFVQGEGGVIPVDKEFINVVFTECEKRDILTIADEVQTGMGRTGAVLTSNLYGVKPDITTLAKGIAGGIPMGACLADEKCSEVLNPGTHGSTFGGNPIACAGGNVVLNKLADESFIKSINEKAEYINNQLRSISSIKTITGIGLMIGFTFGKENLTAMDVVKKALDKGLLLLTAKEKVRLLPPLTITKEEIDKGITILKEII